MRKLAQSGGPASGLPKFFLSMTADQFQIGAVNSKLEQTIRPRANEAAANSR
jgi:hypothetical protein